MVLLEVEGEMKKGLYEKIIDLETFNRIKDSKSAKTRFVDSSDEAKKLASAYEKYIRNALANSETKEEKFALIHKLNQIIGVNDIAKDDKDKLMELLAFHDDDNELKQLQEYRPKTSLASSTLFVGGTSGPSLESELKREIRTADEIYMLISFIKFSGLRLIIDDLREFTKTKPLKIITTSYMGATDYEAILALSKLPNTEIKVSYDVDRTRLHAKAYLFKRNTGFSTAYIGSSNISNPAMTSGLEWNLKVSEYTSKDIILSILKAFDIYWNDDEFSTFSATDEQTKQRLKESLMLKKMKEENSYVFFDLKPYSHQREILEDLRYEREENGSYRNLVVAATGTGKTMVAAFDYKNQIKDGPKKLLFLAHRKEILEQSLFTFRNVLKDQNFGELMVDGIIPTENTHIFSSIQTMNSMNRFENYEKDYFDYIVIDETHHASAGTYSKILNYFESQILLGLTATPERMDGQNITEYFNNRIASEIRLTDAIDRKLLSPFHYFGVTDNADLSGLRWTRGGYEVRDLENIYTINSFVANQRVQLIIDSLKKYVMSLDSMKALGFCVSINHAEFMASSFNAVGIPSIALHSNSNSEDRDKAKQKLAKGEINCIFTVDLFNEGVDIPQVDTVLFLRPTESLTVFLQQLGRGLRLYEDKDALTVLDFVGQAHANYDFSFKLRALSGKTTRPLKDEINDEFPNMPVGSHIKLEKIAKEYIMKNIGSSEFNVNSLRRMLKSFSLNFDMELNLKNFFEMYGLNKNQFYAKYSFYKLKYEVGLLDEYKVDDYDSLKSTLRRVSRVNSKSLLSFMKRVLTEDMDFDALTQRELRLLTMVHYTIWPDKPEISFKKSLEDFKKNNPSMVEEILELCDLNASNLKMIESAYEDSEIPLDIYASYNIDQIMAAFGKTNETFKFPMRQGVDYVSDKNTDLFFITIHKNDSDYLPTTMYNDYAINKNLFNWESQNQTSVDSPTGQRYINDRSDSHKVLLFVRDHKTEFGAPPPYTFLGNARYVSHQGSRPIEIVWKMDHPIPERIIRESDLRAVN